VTAQFLIPLDLKIYEGDATTIIGLSGAGKSVLLKHIIGLLKPDDGQILYRGQPIAQFPFPSLTVATFSPDPQP